MTATAPDGEIHASLSGVTRVYPGAAGHRPVHALGPVDLGLRRGEFFAVVGPSGCGKSTLLEVLAGLQPTTAGTVTFEGQPVAGEVPDGIGVVFQEDASFPWLTVWDNAAFGLRRAAQGIVEVAWTVHRPLPVDQLLHSAATALSLDASTRDNILFGMIRSYLFDRLHTFAWPAPVPSADWINAVFHTTWNDLVDAMDRIQTLQRLEGHPGLLKAAKVVERTYNILKGVTTHRRNRYIDPSLLKEAPERALWDLYNSNKDSVGVGRLIDEKAYDKATLLFGDVFFTPLHQFFDQVLVNVDDEPLRQNRLALMRAINTLYTERIADLSHMTVPPSSPKQKE